MPRRLTHEEYLKSGFERFSEALEHLEDITREARQSGADTVRDMVARADVRATLTSWRDYYRRELVLLARRGGHGIPVRRGASSP